MCFFLERLITQHKVQDVLYKTARIRLQKKDNKTKARMKEFSDLLQVSVNWPEKTTIRTFEWTNFRDLISPFYLAEIGMEVVKHLLIY